MCLSAMGLASCGGGSSFVGFWECTNDPNISLEIARYENYYVIKARDADGEYKREGTFENEGLAVGSNNVGAAMALEFVNDEVV